ncbi:MAG: biotin carboxyl carrier domain-containing protein [Thermomicrobiaceae bacterium]|nr:biotin carboxyl carrier domain-containing protein [Thermomicrobiaceae bacterium]
MAERTIRSPLPGIFYRRPSPEAEPFAREGDQVQAGQVIGLVGVMKTFHEIQADASGRLARFLVEDEEAIRPGQEIAVLDETA